MQQEVMCENNGYIMEHNEEHITTIKNAGTQITRDLMCGHKSVATVLAGRCPYTGHILPLY